jgi:hypothetical protein
MAISNSEVRGLVTGGFDGKANPCGGPTRLAQSNDALQ